MTNLDKNQNKDETPVYHEMPDVSGMPNQAYTAPAPYQSQKVHENIIAGIVGAFLFSLIGGILYFVIYQFGYIAGICGLITVVLSIFGYQLFSGRKNSLKGVIIAILMSILSIVLAEYMGLSYVIYDAYKDTLSITFFDAVQMTPDFLVDPEIIGAFVKDLAIAFVLGAVASFSSIRNAVAGSRSR